MKIKKISLIILGIIFYNLFIYFIDIPIKTGIIIGAKIEALAGCESPVREGKGLKTKLECFNSIDYSSYTIDCCDFDPGYETICKARQCYN